MSTGTTFASLANRDYRLYFFGNSASYLGTWMFRIGQAWLVLELTGSGTLLGVTAALQHLPILVAAPLGGLVADRMDKRRLLLVVESIGSVFAFLLGVLTYLGVVDIWMVFGFALALGVVTAISQPAKKAYIFDMVGPDLVLNAVALNSVIFNAAKMVGPAVAGGLIVVAGVGSSFVANGISFLVFVSVLSRVAARPRAAPVDLGPRTGQLIEGWRYVVGTRELIAPLAVTTVAGLVAYEWNVTLPLFAQTTFSGDATTFGLMFSAMGLGAVAGGLFVAGRTTPSPGNLNRVGLMFSLLLVAVAAAPTLPIALVLFVALGAMSTAFRAIVTAWLQIQSLPQMRGRVMALLSIALTGTTPIGAPSIGWLIEMTTPRVAFALAGVVTATAVLGCVLWLRRAVVERGNPSRPAPP